MVEAARDGHSVTEAAEVGARVLTYDDFMEGVPAMISLVQIEAIFPTAPSSCRSRPNSVIPAIA
jgi:urease subunit gamma